MHKNALSSRIKEDDLRQDKLLKEEEIALKSCPIRQEMAEGSFAHHRHSTAGLFILQDGAKNAAEFSTGG